MILIGVIAFILHYFTKFDSFEGDYVTVVEGRLMLSAKYRLPVAFGQSFAVQQSHGLLLVAKLLLKLSYILKRKKF